MRIRRNRRGAAAALTGTAAMCAAVVTLFALAAGTGGCGGGGGDDGGSSPSPTPTVSPSSSPGAPIFSTRYKVEITWGARSRGVNGGNLSSALSARIGLSRSITANAPDFQFDPEESVYVVQRPGGDASVTQVYESPREVEFNRIQRYLVVFFYSTPDATGTPVGYCLLPAILAPENNGLLQDSINVTGTLTSVQVFAGQTIPVNTAQDVGVICRTGTGEVIPVSGGSAFPEVLSGDDRIRIQNGQIFGIRPGTGTVRARVDNIYSPAQTVEVISDTQVAIDPSNSDISYEESVQLTATVTNAPEDERGVTWSVVGGDENGTITAEGLYKAPKKDGEFTIVAVSNYNPKKQATAIVKVDSKVGVTVEPVEASLSWEESVELKATVTRAPDTSVTWSVEGGDENGTVTAEGVYKAPKRSGTYTVIATSVYDPRKTAQAKITVDSKVGVDVTPAESLVEFEDQVQFTATVTRAPDTSVTWSVVGGDANGTITTGGLYTAPKKDGDYTIVATSNYDTGKQDTAIVRVRSRVTVAVQPKTADISLEETAQFNATVLNARDNSVTWSVVGGAANGTITPAGLFRATKKEGTFTVVATSVYDPTKSDTAQVKVESKVGVRINQGGTAREVKIGVNLQTQFTATVTRAPLDPTVTWELEADSTEPRGTINANTGLYTAPSDRCTDFVIARSKYDPRKFDRVKIIVQEGKVDIIVD